MCNLQQYSNPISYDNSSYAQPAYQPAQESYGGAVAQYDSGASQGQGNFDLSGIQLPAPNMSCYQPGGAGQGQTRYQRHDEPTIYKNIEQNFNMSRTVYRDNTVHHQHNRNVVYNVNRNYNHTVRVVNRDNNYHHYLTNNIVRVNDIHNERIEQVAGESRNHNDYKQTQRVENGGCRRGQSCGNSQAQQQYQAAEPQQSYASAASYQPQYQQSYASYQPQAQQYYSGYQQQGQSYGGYGQSYGGYGQSQSTGYYGGY
jgi:Fe2+ or Zn2+ uptake regulation protein